MRSRIEFKKSWNFSDNIINAKNLYAYPGNILLRKTETDWLVEHICVNCLANISVYLWRLTLASTKHNSFAAILLL